MPSLLAQLKAAVKKHGVVKVSSDMGYRSTNTIRNWIEKNKIPESAKVKVETYLKFHAS